MYENVSKKYNLPIFNFYSLLVVRKVSDNKSSLFVESAGISQVQFKSVLFSVPNWINYKKLLKKIIFITFKKKSKQEA